MPPMRAKNFLTAIRKNWSANSDTEPLGFQKKSGGYFYFEGGVRYERNRLQRSTLKANALGFIDTQKLNSELDRLHKFQTDMERQFLRPGENNLKWQ